MLKIIGIILAFGLGYMTAYNELIAYMLQEKTALYIVMGLTASFLLICIPLERIAEAESIQNPLTALRTSAREHLQRRGSF
ncbi:hypothetical protein V8B55DRAFT_1506713 [Mucor lusitanicus]|uniref:Uncharacterized protein n=2 Tax=Mucor circinelloides f. lusitanicus TaxID=29924 RepID=A0A168Q265_MUCCL|nr:hypothetical protein FB192DRAFT_1445430 [Mucor lusitanicus]OAD08581.1 hypothetical protein MUCCIDRAFT_105548 [Mucor lusitanicus CBS 277.49]